MCKLKSMIVLKDRIYCPDHDNHQQMLEELGIEDNYLGASKTFVRVELSPANGDIAIPVDEWKINVDQDITPKWFDVGAYRERIYETVKAWAAEHIHTNGVVEEISAGIHFVADSATIKTVTGSATIVSSHTRAWSNVNSVTMADNATLVDRYNKTIYQAGDGWTFVKAEEEVPPAND